MAMIALPQRGVAVPDAKQDNFEEFLVDLFTNILYTIFQGSALYDDILENIVQERWLREGELPHKPLSLHLSNFMARLHIHPVKGVYVTVRGQDMYLLRWVEGVNARLVPYNAVFLRIVAQTTPVAADRGPTWAYRENLIHALRNWEIAGDIPPARRRSRRTAEEELERRLLLMATTIDKWSYVDATTCIDAEPDDGDEQRKREYVEICVGMTDVGMSSRQVPKTVVIHLINPPSSYHGTDREAWILGDLLRDTWFHLPTTGDYAEEQYRLLVGTPDVPAREFTDAWHPKGPVTAVGSLTFDYLAELLLPYLGSTGRRLLEQLHTQVDRIGEE